MRSLSRRSKSKQHTSMRKPKITEKERVFSASSSTSNLAINKKYLSKGDKETVREPYVRLRVFPMRVLVVRSPPTRDTLTLTEFEEKGARSGTVERNTDLDVVCFFHQKVTILDRDDARDPLGRGPRRDSSSRLVVALHNASV